MASKKPQSQPGHDIITTTFVGLLGVGVFTLIAGINDELGSAMVVLMWGIALIWALLHTTDFANMVKAL